MKTFLVAVLVSMLSAPAFGGDRRGQVLQPVKVASISPAADAPRLVVAQCDPSDPEHTNCSGNPIDPATLGPGVDAPLAFEADGVTLKKGKSVRIEFSQPAPFSGQLTDPQESVRRERINVRNEVELKTIKTGNVIIPVPAAVAIVVGCIAAGALATWGISKIPAPAKP